MAKIKESETLTIKRSLIRMNPVNPKLHTDERVELQKKNLRKVGYLGGIVWNAASGNLIDGHRRIMALDIINKYDGTEETDYEIKVEMVQMDDKTEKEQLTYMAVGSSKYDIGLIAEYIGDIDYTDLGFNEGELSDILAISGADADAIESPFDDLLSPPAKEPGVGARDGGEEAEDGGEGEPASDAPREKTYEEKVEHMKNVKQQVREGAIRREENENAYVILSFSSFDAKADFCSMLGISTDDKYAKGEDVLSMIE